MFFPNNFHRTLRCCVVALLLFAVAGGARAAGSGGLRREFDPVVVKGSLVRGLAGKSISSLRLFSYSRGGFSPVPFQVDEKDRSGAFVFDNADGRFDARDELVFMAKDAGGKAPAKGKPAGALTGAEIALKDPVDGARGFVYLFEFPAGGAPALSTKDYVRCNKGCTVVDAQTYIVGFSKGAPLVFDNLTVKKAGGGPGTDVLDKLKVRFHAETRLGISIDRNEDEFTSEITGIVDGPVRVVRETSNRMILYGKLPTPSAKSEQIFYYNSFEFPVIINMPLNLNILLTNMSLSITSESSVTWGSRFYNVNNRAGVAVDGKMSPDEKRMNRGAYEWQVVAGTKAPNTGGWLNRLMFDKARTPAKISLHYVDDTSSPNPPDTVPGQIGNLGYIIGNLENLRAGQHPLRTFMYNVKSYAPGDEKRVLDILDRPVAVTVSPR